MSTQNTLHELQEKPILGFSNIVSNIPEQMKTVMRENSEALEEMITNKSRGSRLTKRKRG